MILIAALAVSLGVSVATARADDPDLVTPTDSSNPPAMSAEQCKSGYMEILSDLNSCLTAIPNPMKDPRWTDANGFAELQRQWEIFAAHWNAVLAGTETESGLDPLNAEKQQCLKTATDPFLCNQVFQQKLRELLEQTRNLYPDRIGNAAAQNGSLEVEFEVAFKGCLSNAAAKTKTLRGSCSSAFGLSANSALYCATTRATVSACKANCIKCFNDSEQCSVSEQGSCPKCDRLEADTFSDCDPNSTRHLAFNLPCEKEYRAVQQALDNCSKLPTSGRAQCRKDALVMQATLIGMCQAAMGSSASLPIQDQNSQAGSRLDSGGRASGRTVLPSTNPKETPQLGSIKPKTGAVRGQQRTFSPGVQSGSADVKPKNNLDRFDLGPSFVTTSPSLPNQRSPGKSAQGSSSMQKITTPKSSFDAKPAKNFDNQKMHVIEPQQQIK